MADLYDRFLQFELEHEVFDLEIDSVPVWERLRKPVFGKVLQQNKIGQAHSGIPSGGKGYLTWLKLFLTNTVYRNPFLANNSDILFVGHPRRQKLDDGLWWDIYCDPIHQSLDEQYLHLEHHHNGKHYRPTPTDGIRYLDLIRYGGTFARQLGMEKPEIPDPVDKRIQHITQAMREELDTQIDLTRLIKQNIHKRTTRIVGYRRLLNRIEPEIVVIVVSYGKETLIEACKEQNIPVIELQHGIINANHFGYSFPGERNKKFFPDYLLTFGDFWGENVEFPIPDDRVIPVGYPHLEKSVNKYNDLKPHEQILFISQGTIGAELSKFAMQLSEHPGFNHEIVYKLHPGEYDRWEDEYPWLLDANFRVIDNSQPPLYLLFSESSAQIGVGSTAVYEGLAFGLKTFVYNAHGSQALAPLVDRNAAVFIEEPSELVTAIENYPEDVDIDYFFKSEATSNIKAVLQDLPVRDTDLNSSQ